MEKMIAIAICSLICGIAIYRICKDYHSARTARNAARKLSARIDEIVKSLRNLPYEVEYFLDEMGEIIYCETQYDPKFVVFSDEQIAYLQGRPGTVSIHNHNEDVPPSAQDLNFAAMTKCRLSIVVSPHYIYTVAPGVDGWKSEEEVNAVVNRHRNLLKATLVNREFVGIDTDGAWVFMDDTELETTDEGIAIIAKELGYFYERSELESQNLNPGT